MNMRLYFRLLFAFFIATLIIIMGIFAIAQIANPIYQGIILICFVFIVETTLPFIGVEWALKE